jgi:hypothetical protein
MILTFFGALAKLAGALVVVLVFDRCLRLRFRRFDSDPAASIHYTPDRGRSRMIADK